MLSSVLQDQVALPEHLAQWVQSVQAAQFLGLLALRDHKVILDLLV